MPWSEKQRTAIFLAVKRRKGEAAAKKLMHEHGYGGKKKRRKHPTEADLARLLASKR